MEPMTIFRFLCFCCYLRCSPSASIGALNLVDTISRGGGCVNGRNPVKMMFPITQPLHLLGLFLCFFIY